MICLEKYSANVRNRGQTRRQSSQFERESSTSVPGCHAGRELISRRFYLPSFAFVGDGSGGARGEPDQIGKQLPRVALFLIPLASGEKDNNDRNDKSTTERKLQKGRWRRGPEWWIRIREGVEVALEGTVFVRVTRVGVGAVPLPREMGLATADTRMQRATTRRKAALATKTPRAREDITADGGLRERLDTESLLLTLHKPTLWRLALV